MVLLHDIVLGMRLISLLGCLMLMEIDSLVEMQKIGIEMHRVQPQKLLELRLLVQLQKYEVW